MNALLEILRALGDPTRLRIMRLIGRMELAVGELAAILSQSQPRVSRHVRILADAGLVERRREGAWTFMREGPAFDRWGIAALIGAAAIADASDGGQDEDGARLAEVRAARARAANAYFESHAGAWDSIRALHVADPEVEQAMARLLEPRPLGRMLDVGTGTGRIVELLADRASEVVALDNSPEMLRLARARLGGRAGTPVELRLGDFNALPFADRAFDTIVFHQVLHFAQGPEIPIAEAARVLGPGGRLMVVDFATHDREELRRDHAHARLGFSDDSVARWFADAGVALERIEVLAGGELVVKIWLGLRPGDGRGGVAAWEKAA